MNFRICILSISVLLCTTLTTSAQAERQELEAKRKELSSKIQTTSKLLDETSRTKKNELNKLQTLEAKIHQRRELGAVINSELTLLSENITDTEQMIGLLSRDLGNLKRDYAQMLVHTWRYKSYKNEWVFILSGQFSQIYKRFLYLRRYTEYRKRQIELLKSTRTSLANKIEKLTGLKVDKESLFNEHLEQTKKLSSEVEEKNQMVKKLKSQEATLKKDIQRLEENKNKLSAMIEDAIRTEIARAKEKARKATPAPNDTKSNKAKVTVKETDLPLTPAETILAENFGKNRGRLPWPVGQGTIIGRYGTHPHPVLERVTIKNNGIDIRAPQNSKTKAVFEGEISATFYNPAFQYGVMIQHGDYFTVYSNLSDISVKRGDKITTGQIIGTVYTDGDGNTNLHFEIWKGKSTQDPSSWLK